MPTKLFESRTSHAYALGLVLMVESLLVGVKENMVPPHKLLFLFLSNIKKMLFDPQHPI